MATTVRKYFTDLTSPASLEDLKILQADIEQAVRALLGRITDIETALFRDGDNAPTPPEVYEDALQQIQLTRQQNVSSLPVFEPYSVERGLPTYMDLYGPEPLSPLEEHSDEDEKKKIPESMVPPPVLTAEAPPKVKKVPKAARLAAQLGLEVEPGEEVKPKVKRPRSATKEPRKSRAKPKPLVSTVLSTQEPSPSGSVASAPS